MAAGSRTECST